METHQLMKDIEGCSGCTIHQLLKAHNSSMHLFSGNHQQLKTWIIEITQAQDSSDIFHMKNRVVIQQLHSEMNRLFHNFVAGAMTLVAHSRSMMKDSSVRRELYAEYQNKVSVIFKEDDLSSFIQGYRNYIVHDGGAETTISLNIDVENNSASVELSLDLKRLKVSYTWKAGAKRYIASMGDDIELLNVIEEYAEKVYNFHSEFSKWFYSQHTKEMDELLKLQNEMREMIGDEAD